MRSLFLVLCTLSLVACADVSAQYSGSTVGSPVWNPPVFQWDGSCSPSSDTSPYVQFNVTYSSAGIRGISALADSSLKAGLQIVVYSSLPSATDPCANAVGWGFSNNYGGTVPRIDDFMYFYAATYWFVVTGSTYGGLFAVSVNPTTAFGQTTADNATWIPPFPANSRTSSNGCSTTYPSTTTEPAHTPFGRYTWNQPRAGALDFYIMMLQSDLSDFNGGSYALYQGNLSSALSSAQIANDSCNGLKLLISDTFFDSGAYIANVNFAAATTYTLVFSGANAQTGYWGIQVLSSRVKFFKTNPTYGYNQPNRSSASCVADSSNTALPYFTSSIPVTAKVTLIDIGDADPFGSVDTFSFLYAGANNAAPPATCPSSVALINTADTGDVGPLFGIVNVGTTLTAVVSVWSSGTSVTSNSAATQYVFSGTQLGSVAQSFQASTASSSTSVATSTSSVAAVISTSSSTSGLLSSTSASVASVVSTSSTSTADAAASSSASTTSVASTSSVSTVGVTSTSSVSAVAASSSTSVNAVATSSSTSANAVAASSSTSVNAVAVSTSSSTNAASVATTSSVSSTKSVAATSTGSVSATVASTVATTSTRTVATATSSASTNAAASTTKNSVSVASSTSITASAAASATASTSSSSVSSGSISSLISTAATSTKLVASAASLSSSISSALASITQAAATGSSVAATKATGSTATTASVSASNLIASATASTSGTGLSTIVNSALGSTSQAAATGSTVTAGKATGAAATTSSTSFSALISTAKASSSSTASVSLLSTQVSSMLSSSTAATTGSTSSPTKRRV